MVVSVVLVIPPVGVPQHRCRQSEPAASAVASLDHGCIPRQVKGFAISSMLIELRDQRPSTVILMRATPCPVIPILLAAALERSMTRPVM